MKRLLLLAFLLVSFSASAADSWTAASILATARINHTETLLGNGKVLVTGGQGPNFSLLGSTEVYDAGSNTWTAGASLITARQGHSATRLQNGKVLVVGGTASADLTSCEIYDPASNTWTAAASLAHARDRHSATLLANGMVLVAGGYLGADLIASAEIYDPASNTWGAAGSLAAASVNHTATLLANGKVLVAGGFSGTSTSSVVLGSAQLYDPATNKWTAAASLANARYVHTANLLSNGKVLVAGGFSGTSDLTSAELYDSASDSWTAAASLNNPRDQHSSALLANGKVLVMAGYATALSSKLASTEIYDPAANSWTPGAVMATARVDQTATVMADGRVLVAGGYLNGILGSAELYTPGSGATAPITVAAGYWWNPAEGGRGYTIESNSASGNIFFAAFLYDVSGRATWYSAGPAPMSGPTFSAPLAAYANGQTLTGAYKPAASAASPGNVTITFSDASHASLTWPGGTIAIQRYEFTTGGLNSPPTSTQPQTGYWWNPAEGGRGYVIEVQNNTAFVAGFMYDGSGNPVWYDSGPTAITGSVYQGSWTANTGGQTLTGSYHSPTGTANAGSLSVQFVSSTSGTLTLPDGRQIPIQRYVF